MVVVAFRQHNCSKSVHMHTKQDLTVQLLNQIANITNATISSCAETYTKYVVDATASRADSREVFNEDCDTNEQNAFISCVE
jgi:hypothetical protein